MNFYPKLNTTISSIVNQVISAERKSVLRPVINYVQRKIDQGVAANLNFICTHNSRRSQLSQIWAQAAADHFDIKINSFSGGVEETAFNQRAIDSIKRFGFEVISKGSTTNPIYYVSNGDSGTPLKCFSKIYDDPANSADKFAAIMTCSDADENCPFIPGTEQRIPVRYEDPKAFDGTSEEADRYDERSRQIGSEMFYVFSQIKK